MEQEPVYVMSDKLSQVCEVALGKIYDYRKTQSQEYVQQRTYAYNAKVAKQNKIRSKLTWLGVKLKDYVTPFGMENVIYGELQTLQSSGPEAVQAHPMCQINAQYGDMEHMAKDAMIQCAMNESVLVTSDMARGISHLGIPLDFCQRRKIGFLP